MSEESDAVSEVKHRHGNSVASINMSIIYITMCKNKEPIHKLSRSKAPKHSNQWSFLRLNKVSPLNNRTSTLTSVQCASIN